MAFQISKPSFSFTHKKVAKRFAKIQGVKRILSHIKFPAKFFLNMEKGRFSIIQICQIKSVFSSFFLNYLIHKVFFSTAKNKIKIKHRSKILQNNHIFLKTSKVWKQLCNVWSTHKQKMLLKEIGLIHRSL